MHSEVERLRKQVQEYESALADMRQYALRMQRQRQPQVIQERLYVIKRTGQALKDKAQPSGLYKTVTVNVYFGE